MKIIFVLLVHEDPSQTQHVRRNLDRMKVLYSLQLVKTGEEALQFLQARSRPSSLPDVVLISEHLPDMESSELAETIHNNPRFGDIRCYLLTSTASSVNTHERIRL